MPYAANAKDQALLDEIQRNLKYAWEAESEQRQRELADLEFRVEQWDEDAKRARQGSQSDGAPPARPMLQIPKLEQPLAQIDAQYRNAHLGVQVHPRNELSSKETAQVLQDLYRRIEQDSGADGVRWWAYDRAKQCGSGAYRIVAEYDDDTTDPFDQKLSIRRIYDQSLVFFDPSCERADRLDGRFAFILTWIPVESFKEQWPNAEVDYADEATFNDLDIGQIQEPRWVRQDGKRRGVLVAEYYRRVQNERNYVTFQDGSHGYEDEAGKRVPNAEGPSRKRSTWNVEIYHATAFELLASSVWGGRHIPLVPTVGKELQPWDGERRHEGVIRMAKDAVQGYNYSVTSAIEAVSGAPRAPIVGFAGQFEGHEAKWDTINTRLWSYLEVNPVTVDGKPAPFPQRMQVDMGALAAAMQLAQQFDQDVQSSTGVFDPAMGRLSKKERSGIAIERLQAQTESGTSVYLYNMATYTLPAEATIILDVIPYYYDRPGRVAQVLDAEDRTRPVMLGAPFRMDDQTGMPMRAEGWEPGMPAPEGSKFYDFSKGAYGVQVTIGKSFASRQQQGGEQLGQVIQSDPALMMAFGDIWARFLDIPGSPEIAERLLKLIEKAHPGLTKKEGEQETPTQLKARLQAQEGQLQQMQQMLQQATQTLETKAAEQKAMLAKTEMDNSARQAMTEQNNQTKLLLERMAEQSALVIEMLKQRGKIEELKHDKALARVNFARGEVDAIHGDEREDMAMDREDERSEAERARAQADGDRGE